MLSFQTSETRAIIEGADSIRAYRIESLRKDGDGYKELDPPVRFFGPVELDRPQRRALIAAMTARGSDQAVPACIPNPGVEFVFIRGNDSVMLDLCFQCQRAFFLDSFHKQLAPANFGHVREGFVDVCKSVFPSDPRIQSLSRDVNAFTLEGRPGELPPSPARLK